MFYDCTKMWRKVFETSHQCNSELVPEWFYLPQLFQNKNYYNFGRLNNLNNQTCHDVFLPKWTNKNPFIFCMKYREFLEDPVYAKDLPEWIDIIFGKKQQKEENKNIFFEYATPEFYERTKIEDLKQTLALNSATEFYQLPKCIFGKEHRIIQQRELNEAQPEEPNAEPGQELPKNDELKIRVSTTIFRKKVEKVEKNRKGQKLAEFEVIGGNARDESSSCYLVWKMEKDVSLVLIQKQAKINPAVGDI